MLFLSNLLSHYFKETIELHNVLSQRHIKGKWAVWEIQNQLNSTWISDSLKTPDIKMRRSRKTILNLSWIISLIPGNTWYISCIYTCLFHISLQCSHKPPVTYLCCHFTMKKIYMHIYYEWNYYYMMMMIYDLLIYKNLISVMICFLRTIQVFILCIMFYFVVL